MKKVYILFSTLLIGIAAHSQCSVLINNVQNVSCNGACDGEATATAIGFPTYSYSWAPGGQTIQNPSDLCPGTHTVTMTDANSCVATATVQITEPAVLTVQMSMNPVTCHGECDGEAIATPSGGTGPYDYQWDSTASNQMTSVANNLCPGNYSVVVTDNNGCTTSGSIMVTEPTALGISTSAVPTTCQNCTDGSATAQVTGGTPSYSYLWTPSGQTTQTASNLGSGSYTVTATDAEGCTIMDTVVVSSPTGIVSDAPGIYLHVYPNPIYNMANIEVGHVEGGVMVVSLFDVTGKLMESKQINAPRGTTIQMNFESYPSGAYLMEVRAGDAKTTVKVFKQ